MKKLLKKLCSYYNETPAPAAPAAVPRPQSKPSEEQSQDRLGAGDSKSSTSVSGDSKKGAIPPLSTTGTSAAVPPADVKDEKKTTRRSGSVLCYVDLHGHSKKLGWFTYGCHSPELGSQTLRDPRILPLSLRKTSPTTFSYPSSTFTMNKEKDGSARISVYRDFGISLSYTIEASLGGYVRGGAGAGGPRGGAVGGAAGTRDGGTTTFTGLEMEEAVHFVAGDYLAMGRDLALAFVGWIPKTRSHHETARKINVSVGKSAAAAGKSAAGKLLLRKNSPKEEDLISKAVVSGPGGVEDQHWCPHPQSAEDHFSKSNHSDPDLHTEEDNPSPPALPSKEDSVSQASITSTVSSIFDGAGELHNVFADAPDLMAGAGQVKIIEHEHDSESDPDEQSDHEAERKFKVAEKVGKTLKKKVKKLFANKRPATAGSSVSSAPLSAETASLGSSVVGGGTTSPASMVRFFPKSASSPLPHYLSMYIPRHYL